MRYTNNANLPNSIVRAVMKDPYNKGDVDFSVTELLKPARIRQLEILHRDELTEDVSDRIWALLGQIAHGILDRAGVEKNVICEKRYFMQIKDKYISGAIDRYDMQTKTLSDYKVTSVYKVKNGLPKEYEEQINLYIQLLFENKLKVEHAEIIAILRDWSRPESLRNLDYPKTQVMKLNVPIWGQQRRIDFIKEKLTSHELAAIGLPDCTDEERWATKEQIAVIKDGRKSALRLFDNELDAKAYIAKNSGLKIEYRPKQYNRCNGYCSVASFCKQNQKGKNNETNDKINN